MCAFGVDGTITGSYNTGVVSGEGCVGGVCGTGSSVTITDSYNTGSVSGNDDVGGVFGYGENCTINNCYYLKAEGTDLGGINGADVEGQAEGKPLHSLHPARLHTFCRMDRKWEKMARYHRSGDRTLIMMVRNNLFLF